MRHLEKPHTIPDLANFADLTVSRLCHLFKEQVGETIGEKLNKMRLEKSSRILKLTSRKIQDIALEVGFESPFILQENTHNFLARVQPILESMLMINGFTTIMT